MEDLENQYLKALEEDYNKQLNQKIKAQQQFHNASNNIKRLIKKIKRQKQHYGALIIQSYWRFKKQKRFQQTKSPKLQILGQAFYKIKRHHINQKHNIIKQVIYIQKSYRKYQTREKKNLISIIQGLKQLGQSKNLQNQIDSLIRSRLEINRKILIKQIAIKKEMQFIDNIIEINQRFFENNKIQYQKRLNLYIQQKCKAESDYIVKYNNQNDPYWIRLKDGKQLYVDPFIKLKEQNLKLCTQVSIQSQENFIQEMEYYKGCLIELLRNLK